MKQFPAIAAVTLVAAGLAALPCAAHAQLLGQYYPVGIPGYGSWFSDAVLDRPRPEYAAPGSRAGSFLIHPSLSESLGYNSNILGAAVAVASPFAETRGRVGVASDWRRDALAASIGFDRTQFLRQPRASYTDWTGGLGGALDIGRDRATLAYAHITATTGALQIGTLSVGQPVTVTLDSARASYAARFGRVTLEPALQLGIYRLTPGPAGGASEATNDHDSFAGSLTASYAAAPGRTLVLVASGTRAAYTINMPGVPRPDYTDVAVVAGIDTSSGPVLRARATLGYEQRRYASPQLAATASPVAEADVIWTPTRLTTVTGELARNLQSAIAASGSQGFTYTSARVVVDHEYLRNVLLQGFAEFQHGSYQLRGETQRIVSAGASVTWLLSRRLSVIGRYRYARSTDNVNAGLNLTGSLAELTLDVHL